MHSYLESRCTRLSRALRHLLSGPLASACRGFASIPGVHLGGLWHRGRFAFARREEQQLRALRALNERHIVELEVAYAQAIAYRNQIDGALSLNDKAQMRALLALREQPQHST